MTFDLMLTGLHDDFPRQKLHYGEIYTNMKLFSLAFFKEKKMFLRKKSIEKYFFLQVRFSSLWGTISC